MMAPNVLAVRRPSDYEAVLDLALPGNHPAFAGHFPGLPILPGVVQIDWAVRLAAEHFAIPRPPGCEFQVKFRRVVQPGAPLELTLRLDRGKGRLSFEYRSNGEIISNGRLDTAGSP